MPRAEPGRGRTILRLRYASDLWRQYVSHDPLPQFDRWLAAALKQYPKFGRKDRRAYSDILFAAVRFAYLGAFLDFARQRSATSADERGGPDIASALGAFARLFATPEDAVKAVRHVPVEIVLCVAGLRYEPATGADEWPLADAPLAEGVRQLERMLLALQQEGCKGSFAAKLLLQGIPLWFAEPLARRVERSGWNGTELDAFLAAQARRPPLWLRLNHAARRQQVVDELLRTGFDAVADDSAVRVVGERGIYELNAYRSGAVEIQDWASQQIGADVELRPGQLVWDACAGGGGKSVQLAAALANRGAVYASDIRDFKLAEVRRRAARAGFHNVRTLVWNGEAPPPFGREVAKQNGFHWVLVDAPCSSTGTWRRNPDARFRFSTAGLPALVALQLQLLTNAAKAVRKGGGLVYSTCSWLVEENEAIVERFLADQPAFTLMRATVHGCPYVDADTMFSAVMVRGG